MPKIHELLERDPRTAALANKGQARIGGAAEGSADDELRAELQAFVCSGRFSDGLVRILERFLANLESGKRQEAAWISGFFGSGKSHLLKMLAHLWADTRFEDGATARGLVPGGLPPDIRAALAELDTRARRAGKPLHAAAGTLLGGNERVRAAVLAVLLRANRLPTGIPQARFVFWLREQGCLDEVRSDIEAGGGVWRRELNALHVSRRIAEALLRSVPDFAPGPKEVRRTLAAQFPPSTADLTTEEFTDLARKALSEDERLPLTVLVLDEAQQYIGDSSARSAVFTEVAEAVQTGLDGRVALVASGQSALSGTPALQKLRDRFRIQVELTDADVEVVTRRVLLAKKPSAVPAVETMFESAAGEVSRHLRDTKVGARSADSGARVEDYPLLGSRRRFWEACLRAVDAGQGVHSQLRSQLRILHDSLAALADRDLGAAIPASDLFHAISADLVNSGVLLNELHTRIARLGDGTEDGELRRNLAALVFLIGRLPREKAVDAGVRADPPTLADLLVSDLAADSGPFRQRVADALEALAEERVLMRVGGEYRMQTTEGAEWDGEFERQRAALGNDEAAIAAARDSLFGEALRKTISAIRLRQGKSKQPRSLDLQRGAEPPKRGGEAVPVWMRDGWQCSEKDFREDARRLGADDPTIHLHLPKQTGDPLRARLVAKLAAQRVLDHRGSPHSPEGREARAAMDSRLAAAEKGCSGVLASILREARMALSGSGALSASGGLQERIEHGANASLARLFPRFPEGDAAAWGAALRRAREGSDRPFAPAGWDQDPADHPVAKEVLKTVGASARGTEVQRALRAAPFGWPQDAVDAALIALASAGRLRASRNGQPVAPDALDQTGVKAATFRPEQVVLTATERIALRGLFRHAGVPVSPGDEERGATEYLRALRDLAVRAGGDPPLPAPPVSALLEEMARLAGNERLRRIHEERETLERLRAAWAALADRAAPRLAAWRRAQALRRRARGLPLEEEAGPELDAILGQRSLLEETDRVAPLVQKLAEAVRTEVTARRRALDEAIRRAGEDLEADPHWRDLGEEDRARLERDHQLLPPLPPAVGTDEALLRALADRPLDAWRAEADAVPARTARAIAEAAKLARRTKGDDDGARPRTVTVRRATLRDEAAVRGWLRETETALLAEIANGPVVIE